jgi:DNA-binding MarR family transcriptional regulator
MFGEPAWDMLLELFAAERLGKKFSVSGLCYCSGVPATTALRWIDRLEKVGWINREADEADRRRYWVRLSDRGSAAMLRYFRSLEVRSI